MKINIGAQITSIKNIFYMVFIFSILACSGCSNKESAVKALAAAGVAPTLDSLTDFSNKGDLEKIKLLKAAGLDVNAKDSHGNVALIEASWGGQKDVVTFLLDEKADANASSSAKLTPLLAATAGAKSNSDSIVELLVEHGANPNIADTSGTTPLINASWSGNLVSVKALLAKGAELNYTRTADGMTAYKAALSANKPEVANLLKISGANEH